MNNNNTVYSLYNDIIGYGLNLEVKVIKNT